MYPDSSLDHFEMAVGESLRPNGTTGAVMSLQALDETGAPDGFGINAWSSNAWIGMQDGTSTWNPVLIFQQVGGGLFAKGTFVQVASPNTYIQVADTGFTYNTRPGGSSLSMGAAAGFHLDGAGHDSIIGTAPNNYILFSSAGVTITSNGSAKTFVIDHPLDDPDDPQRWLVHAVTESPVAGVEYTGTAIMEDHQAVVELPSYFEALTLPDGRTVQLTPQAVEVNGRPSAFPAAYTPIVNGRFTIACDAPDGTPVSWHVRATRKGADFDIEPYRADVLAHGDGPYRYLTRPPGAEGLATPFLAPRSKDAA